MEFRFTPDQENFRQEIRDFLKGALAGIARDASGGEPEDAHVSEDFSRSLAAKRWIGLSWPEEYGGQALGHIERYIYTEEMTYHQAPMGFHDTAERQMGPSIIVSGNDYQRKSYLPDIARAKISMCIGYSEPNAGSDLAAVETTAVRDGDDFVINGQKMYTTGAHRADYIWLAVRTDPEAPKHRGISVFLVPLNAPGVDVQPLWTMADSRLNHVFFHNVRVNAREMVGEENRGWYVVAGNLDLERSGIERVTANQLLFEEVTRYAREIRGNGGAIMDDPVVANRLAETAIEFAVGRMLAFRVAWLASKGKSPNYEASVSKVYGSELSQRTAQAGLQVLGLYGQVAESPRWAKLRGRVLRHYHLAVSDTIRAGSSEVQRNIIATRGLGLPR